jgi:nucleoid DNA-binding protein
MPLSSALTKAHIIDAVIEQNGYTRKKSIETVEILLELIGGEWGRTKLSD